MIFADRLRSISSRTPDRTAIHLQHAGREDLPISYAQLMRGATSYAHTYAREGINPGEVVVLILQHGEDLIFAFWGAILHGAIPSIMPFMTEKLSPDRYRADLATLVSVTQPAGIVTYPEFKDEVQASLAEGGPVRRVIVIDQLEM